MKLFVATHNQHKIREISQILPGLDIVADDPEDVEENAPDFVGNALIKVRAIAARHAGAWSMADDSGLEVEALGGAPGVRSARYAGEPSNTPNNNALLLKNLTGVTNRRANFTCAVALVDPEGHEHTVVGKCFGRIAEAPSGAEGFGYDPLFVPDGHDRSFAELTADEKNAISHRGRALEQVRALVADADASEKAPPAARPSFGARLQAWLRFFRVVNLPTVPGDVFVGAAAVFYASGRGALAPVVVAALASCFLYLYGLADNDIVGAKTDADHPIAKGEISLRAARVARTLCWTAALLLGVFGDLPRAWFWVALALLAVILGYNRWKKAWLMGLCRGLNVLAGAAAVLPCLAEGTAPGRRRAYWFAAGLAVLWTAYIGWVTKFSEGEEQDVHRRQAVGMLIGALVYLQLAALVLFTLGAPEQALLRPLLLTGAVLLVVLRLFRNLFPKVSAS